MIELHWLSLLLFSGLLLRCGYKIGRAGRDVERFEKSIANQPSPPPEAKEPAKEEAEECEFVAFITNGERYFLTYEKNDIPAAVRTLHEWLVDPELSFDQEMFDLAIRQIRDREFAG